MTGPDQRPNNPPDIEPSYVPIFTIPRDNPMDTESWEQIMSQPSVDERGRRLLMGIKNNVGIVISSPSLVGLRIYEGVASMFIVTAIADPSRRIDVDVDEFERFVSSVGRASGIKLGCTIAEWVSWPNDTQTIVHRTESKPQARTYGFKFE